MQEVENLLIVATSGRMLAQSCKAVSCSCLVIDCFSDLDTEFFSLDHIKVESLAISHVEAAVGLLQKQYQISHVIYGSGLECHVVTLAFLQQHFIVWGNTMETFLAVQDKQQFFSSLDRLKISYPLTVFKQPDTNQGWLVKPMQGEGGEGIFQHQYHIDYIDTSYWQKYCPGVAMSVLFMANNNAYKIVGFNKQLNVSLGNKEFIFSGVISQPEIEFDIVKKVSHWLDNLVPEFYLKGLNSLDFIVQENECYLLEINPRPSASMQLYTEQCLLAYLNGGWPETMGRCDLENNYHGYKIVFAETDYVISKQITWPSWVADIPRVGTFIQTNIPICSIIANGKTEQQVERLLLLREQEIKRLLK